ncbi:Calcium-binding EF hand family protein isoform 1 [Dorcoceras hygrometricum]|uniref:Calcium-binding EF hand family protein isoform 1 n=1 Tax=Dorcoceras hygrometricum TaxID=472368 RepID=A0A2Z7BQ43_9LAMI|nr:Calcium-binding EF hand family protein isoform 1 [Dorcoceras hygrometricum]
MTFRVVRTNQYNQDLGLIHSTNGNHLKSPNEGSSIDHQNQLLSKTDNLEKALVEAHTQQDQVLRGLIKNVRQEVQIQKDALSLEMLESKREVRAQYVILTTYLADIRKEVQDQKAAMLAFREESQEHYSTLHEHLVEIIAYINRGRDDKLGESV